jgi:hypothetical protein
MLINITEHQLKTFQKSCKRLNSTHVEIHTVTTIWFLFIPIWKYKKLKQSNII